MKDAVYQDLLDNKEVFDRQKSIHGFIPSQDLKTYELYPEFNDAMNLRAIQCFSERVIAKKGKPIFSRAFRRDRYHWFREYKVCINPPSILSYCVLRRKDVFYSLEIELFFEAVEENEKALGGDGCLLVEKKLIMNELAAKIYEKSLSSSYKARSRERKKSSKKRLKSYFDYCYKILGNNSRLLVVNIDFHYKKDFSNGISEMEAKRHRDEILEYVKNTEGYLGYICKLEEGLKKGIHMHLLVMMNGHRRKSSYTLVREWGEYWTSTVTGGIGYYYDCQAGHPMYAWRNVGKVYYANKETIDKLKRAISYLTKPDQFLLVKRNLKGKQLTRGKMPKMKKTGRPRKHNLPVLGQLAVDKKMEGA